MIVSPPDVRTCQGCGCTDLEMCAEGCEWVEENRCSSCAMNGAGTVPSNGAGTVPAYRQPLVPRQVA